MEETNLHPRLHRHIVHYFLYIISESVRFDHLRPRLFHFSDIIQEVIAEERERLAASMPGPPPPPADLLCQQISLSQNLRMLRQSSSAASQPVLVARGTATQVSERHRCMLGVKTIRGLASSFCFMCFLTVANKAAQFSQNIIL